MLIHRHIRYIVSFTLYANHQTNHVKSFIQLFSSKINIENIKHLNFRKYTIKDLLQIVRILLKIICYKFILFIILFVLCVKTK